MKHFPIATASPLSLPRYFRPAVSTFILLLATGSARGETADERVAALSTKLGELLTAKPGDAGNTVSAFSKNIVKRAPEGSLANRLDDEKLIRLAVGLAAAIPGEKQSELQVRIKSRVAKEALDRLRAAERSLDGIVQSSDNREAALTALTTAPELSPLLKIIRNPDHEDGADALTGLAIIIKSRLVEGRLGTAKANGSESAAADGLSTLPHIRQHGELCVPTCGLMSLGHLAGVAFDSSMLDSLGDIYHRRTGNGTMGSSPEKLYPLMEVVPSNAGPSALNDVNVWIGRSNFGGDHNFHGMINEVRLYDYALDENQVQGNLLAVPDDLNLTDEAIWAAFYGLNPQGDGSMTADPDQDGLSNELEYAFGLNPVDGASSSPFITLNLENGTLSYTRRDPGLTGLAYKVFTSTDLSEWSEDQQAVQISGTTSIQGIQTVVVTISDATVSGRLFARIVATR